MRTIKGFTLIEMIAVMLILSVIAGISATLIASGFRNYFKEVQLTGLNQEGTIAMLRMSKEIQKAISFTTITANTVTFTPIDSTAVTYSWSNPTLTRTGTQARTLSGSVTSFSFAYYQSNFSTTASTSAVRAVTITMTLSNANERVTLINTVYLNNMK